MTAIISVVSTFFSEHERPNIHGVRYFINFYSMLMQACDQSTSPLLAYSREHIMVLLQVRALVAMIMAILKRKDSVV